MDTDVYPNLWTSGKAISWERTGKTRIEQETKQRKRFEKELKINVVQLSL